jgi:hypothetical protein
VASVSDVLAGAGQLTCATIEAVLAKSDLELGGASWNAHWR